MGEEAIKYANSYALEAERKMGQLIKQGQDSGIVRERGRYPKSTTSEPLELSELGLTRRGMHPNCRKNLKHWKQVKHSTIPRLISCKL